MFVNQNGKVLDVSGGQDKEGQKTIVWKKHGGANQRWTIVYVDKAKPIQTKGYNEEFGFHINRPFYIVSRLPMGRVVQAQGNNWIRMNRWVKNRAAQRWKFDGVKKAIYNMNWTSWHMEIYNKGNHKNVAIGSSNQSRWW